ncbi:MAG: hypothetical protein K2Q12_01860 [Rickettsiales bacterium]|nr:hypothetical protein [Rickettsiales bacterium]
MDETTHSATNDSRLKRRAAGSGVALFIAAIVVLVIIGFFASHSGIDKKLAQKRLAEWARVASEMAAEQGYVLTLDYDAIDIEGSLFSKRAAVRNVSLSAIPQDSPDQARVLSTDVLYLDPDIMGGGLSVILTEPLLYTTADVRTRLVAGEPIEMVVEDYKNDSGSGIAYTLLTPPHMSMERLGRQSDAVISTTDFSFGPQSKIYGMVDLDKGTYTQEAQIKLLGMKRNDRTVNIANFESIMESASENGSLLTHYQLTLHGITTNGPLEPLGVMNARLDVEFEEPTLVNGEPLNLSLGHDRNITLETLLVDTPSGKLLAKARLRQLQNEIMPFGNATLQVENPKQLLDALSRTSYLSNIPQDIVKTMIARMAPQWKGDNDTLTIPLKREPNGPFYLGDLTFEEFTAVLLSQLLHQASSDLPLPVALPSAAVPSAAAPSSPSPDETQPASAPEAQSPNATPAADENPDAVPPAEIPAKESLAPQAKPEEDAVVPPVGSGAPISDGEKAPTQ